MDKTKALLKEQLVFLDETGFENNEVNLKAWSARGVKVLADKMARPSQRYSLVSGFNKSRLVGSMVFIGYMTREIFEEYLEKVLIKYLKPRQVVVLDNARFHVGGKVKEIIESVNCKVLYLPPYCPHLNPIEKIWASVKNFVRKSFSVVEPTLTPTLN